MKQQPKARSHARLLSSLIVAFATLLVAPFSALAQEGGEASGPRVEVAFVLDTTGSMSGLIEGAKAKIWDIANLIVSADPTPDVRFGLIGYRDRGDDYITQVYDLTDDIDAIYGHLMDFSAGGGGDGPESVNQALHEAVTQLGWTSLEEGEDVLRIIFLVGDAPPHMDYTQDTPYTESAPLAVSRGIIVNTIQCGSDASTQTIWQEIARLADGQFTAIGQSGDVAVIATPFDEELARLNSELGSTVVAYGGAEERERTEGYMEAAEEAAPAAAADRLSYHRTRGTVAGAGGDLVDAVRDGRVDLDDVEADELPDNLRGMSSEERAAYIEQQQARRGEIEAQIDQLLEQRREYIEAERARMREAGSLSGFDAEVDRMIREQAAGVGITFE